jgi:LysR family transcriptional regulator, regulator for metE and metH
MDLEIRHLRLVSTVAEQGSLTRAGERLHLTQSALSHQLLDIEERLGTPLFLRVKKRMVLTQAGQRILTTASRVLGDIERAEEEVRDLALDRAGTIRLTTECYTCYHWLPPLLKEFQARYQRVEVRIEADATSRPFEALLDRQLDVAIVSSTPRNHRLEFYPLFEDELVVVVAPDHPLAANHHITAAELADEQLLTYSTLDDNTVYQQLLRPRGLTPRSTTQVRLTEAMVELVRAGMGVAVLARWAVAREIDDGSLIAVPLTSRGFQRRWQAVTLRGPQSRYLKDFIGLLARGVNRRRTRTRIAS